MAEQHEGYVQNRAIPMVLSFFRASYNPTSGLCSPADPKWLLGWGGGGGCGLGALGTAEQGAGQRSRSFAPFPSPSISSSGIWAATGLQAGKKGGTSAHHQGLVWGVGGDTKELVFFSGTCAKGCARVGAGMSPLPVLPGERSRGLEQE